MSLTLDKQIHWCHTGCVYCLTPLKAIYFWKKGTKSVSTNTNLIMSVFNCCWTNCFFNARISRSSVKKFDPSEKGFKMSFEKLCFKWNDFWSNMFSTYKDLSQDQAFADVTLVCEDNQIIEAHKVTLLNHRTRDQIME